MKKLIALLLIVVIAFSITACTDKHKDDNVTQQTTIKLDAEKLKANWKSGEITFADGKKATIPCTPKELAEKSGLSIRNYDAISIKTLAPGESFTINIVNDNTSIDVKCENKTEEPINILDSTVIKYSFNNTKSGNKEVFFAESLTVGVTRDAIVDALGEPKSTAGEDTLYFYTGKNSKGKRIELRVGFNANNIVNSVSYEVK